MTYECIILCPIKVQNMIYFSLKNKNIPSKCTQNLINIQKTQPQAST